MIRRYLLLAALLDLVAGCASKPARFETSYAPPPELEEDLQLSAYQVPIQPPAGSRYQLELTTDRFLLALQNRAPEQLESLLAPEATIREHASGSGSPALPALLELSSSWSPVLEQDTLVSASSVPLFGPARIVDLTTQGRQGWATVEVEGPPKVRGLWTIRYGDADETPQVAEIILPKTK